MGLVGAPATLAAEAVRAVNGLATGRAEGDLSLLAAVRACRAEHLARPAVAVSTAAATAAVAATATAAVAATAAGGIPAAGSVAAVAAAGPGAAAVGVASSLAAGATRRATARL